ncbi:MAG: ATP-binding protein [Candidatus Falkowbacteria bacterium]
MVILNAGIFWYLQTTLVNQRLAEVKRLNSDQAYKAAQVFDYNLLLVKMLATRSQIVDSLANRTAAQDDATLQSFTKYTSENRSYLALYLLDAKGKAIVSTDQTFVGNDYSLRNYYQQALKGLSSVDVLIGVTSKELGFYYSYPVNSADGQLLGVVVLKTNDQAIKQLVNNNQLSQEGVVMLVDDLGIILSSSEPYRVLSSLGPLSDEEKKLIAQQNRYLGKTINPLQYQNVKDSIVKYTENTSVFMYDAEDNDREILGIAKLDSFPYYIVSEIRLNSLTDAILWNLLIIIALTTIGLVLFAFSIYRLIIIFIRPLQSFKELSQSISLGDFTKKISIKSHDEFADLADAFNKMVDNLASLYRGMDKKVDEKTSEIEAKNSSLREQQQAIMNMLEDVEEEKSQVETQANNLLKFQLAVENVSDQIIITDIEGIVIYGNKAVEKITGYTAQEAMGKKAGVLWKLPMPTAYYQKMWQVIKTEKKIFSGEVRNKNKSGEVYDAFISIVPVLNNQGEVIYFVGIERDITKEKKIEKAKNEFVSLASHQLRTPLTAIKLFAEALGDEQVGPLNVQQKDYLVDLAQSVERLITLVNDLLNISRLDSGRLKINPEPIDLQQLVQSIVREFEMLLPQGGKIEVDFPEKLAKINLDESAIRQVVYNLIANAVRYSPVDKCLISIKLQKTKGQYVLQIKDQGIGIPFEDQAKVFSKFFRSSEAVKMQAEGSGLGLYLALMIVESSGGRLWFESAGKNKGTTFFISFSEVGMVKREGEVGLSP